MSRRRSAPWIHRWSRQLIGLIAIVGALLTAYLTVVKLTGSTVACSGTEAAAASAASCNSVLASPYATVFGLPLTLLGCLAYISMATFALAPLAVNSEHKKELRSQLENGTWLLLLAGATAMTTFSGYLMYVLAFKLHAVCPYCIGSALFSLSMLVLTLMGRTWEDIGQLFFIGIVVGMVTLISTLGVYAQVGGGSTSAKNRTPIPEATSAPQPVVGWEITTTSGEAEIALARHLTKVGVKEYGAYWCPHCYEQKQLFGKQAYKDINYTECTPDGKNGQPQVCKDVGVKAFPTWSINGKLTAGVKTLDQLADETGYKGPRNFKYTLPGQPVE